MQPGITTEAQNAMTKVAQLVRSDVIDHLEFQKCGSTFNMCFFCLKLPPFLQYLFGGVQFESASTVLRQLSLLARLRGGQITNTFTLFIALHLY